MPFVSDDIISSIERNSNERTCHRRPQRAAQRAGRPAGRAPRALGQPGHQGPRRRLARVRKPDLARAEAFAAAFGFTTALRTQDELHLRGTDPGAPCVLIRRGRARGSSGRRSSPSSPICCGWPTRPAAQFARCPSPLAGWRSSWSTPAAGAARRVGHPPAGGAARPATARVQLRPRGGPGQHHPAAAAGTHPGAAARARGRADPQVPRSAELVFGSPGDDRQRLLFLPRPARARTDHELHPLRPRIRPRRSPHPGDGAGSGRSLRAFGLSGR